MMYTNWLLRARKIIDMAKTKERISGDLQDITFWGQTKHWSEWARIWQKEKDLLLRKYGLKNVTVFNSSTENRDDTDNRDRS